MRKWLKLLLLVNIVDTVLCLIIIAFDESFTFHGLSLLWMWWVGTIIGYSIGRLEEKGGF